MISFRMNRIAKNARRAFLLLSLLSPSVVVADAVDDQLRTEYVGKVLTLRRFYKGDHLSFRADGTLDGDARIGPWTIDGEIFVNKAFASGTTLHLKGRRLVLLFDSKTKTFQDTLMHLEEYRGKDRTRVEDLLNGMKVEIDIRLSQEATDAQQISKAMQAVFLAPNESMTNVVPDYWRSYFDFVEHKANTLRPEGVYSVGNGVSPPKPISAPEPEYTDSGRGVKWQGTVLVSLVVDEDGKPRNLQIARPLGAGLDDKSVEAVETWKFEPAQKDGKPVRVAIMVEVTFHLY